MRVNPEHESCSGDELPPQYPVVEVHIPEGPNAELHNARRRPSFVFLESIRKPSGAACASRDRGLGSQMSAEVDALPLKSKQFEFCADAMRTFCLLHSRTSSRRN